ncbi:transcription termination/antitermination protein NusG [Rhizobium sp. SGZ-381]|uniref:transcription termination/antitermination protein NusG n=1 Tax=Rhizobium sp. SGZ-381 TaxID=3342800 RepID=UPI00366AA46F
MQHKALTGLPIGIARDTDQDRRERLKRLRGCCDSGVHMRWFAARVASGREQAVENQLTDIGIEALVPMRKGPDLRRRHRVIPGVMMPVIHGYVLVHMPVDGVVLAGLRCLDHFISLVGGYERPMAITAQEVKRFKDLAEAGVYDWEKPTGKVFRRGDRVKLFDGPFTGFDGEVVSCRSDGKGDVVVSLEVFGRETHVTVPLAICEKL